MNNLTKLYQIQELINESLHEFSQNRIELDEYIQTLINKELRISIKSTILTRTVTDNITE